MAPSETAPAEKTGELDRVSFLVGAAGAVRKHLPRPPWKVFLSYTSELRQYPDNPSFVEAAARAVARAGHAVVDMRTWTATETPSAQVCEQRVLECDVYVGLLGFRYGSPVRDTPNRSYVELEFDTAAVAGLPRLALVLAEDLAV